jgi:hypothetical protein
METKTLLSWKPVGQYREEEAILCDFNGGDGVRFSLGFYPSCHRRGQWRLLVEVAGGEHHLEWGCFDDQDQPMRYYHRKENALDEAESIARALMEGRFLKRGT